MTQSDPRLAAMLRLIASKARQDAYIRYIPGRGGHKAEWVRVGEPLTEAVLDWHLSGGPTAGIYVYPRGESRTHLLIFDLDDHDGSVDPEEVREVALALSAAAARHGIHLLPLRSGGGRGCHLWAYWDEIQFGRHVRALAKMIVNELVLKAEADGEIRYSEGAGGLGKGQIEIFPKGNGVGEDGFGTGVALPFARASVPLDPNMRPAEAPFDWPASEPVPLIEEEPPPCRAFGDPVAPIEDIVAALSMIPNNPSTDYDEYIGVGMATAAASGGSEEGYTAWDAWARRRQDKYDPNDTRRRWPTFRPTRTGFGALVNRAQKYSPDWVVPSVPRVITELNEIYAVIRVTNRAAILNQHLDAEGQPSFSLLPPSSFKLLLANRSMEIGDRKMPLADYWIRHRHRRSHEGIVFAPQGAPTEYYNLWNGFAVEPSPLGTCDLFKAHLLDNVCQGSEDLYVWVFGWFADIFQWPAKKCGTSLVLRGSMGVGKSLVGGAFGRLLGSHYVQVADQRYITGRFNAHLVRCLLLHCDEAFWAGDHAAEGKLKDLVTGERHPIELKGYEAFFVPNYIRMFVTGNPDWLVPAGMDERRFATIDVGEGHKQDIPYFKAIDNELKAGGHSKLLYELLTFDLDRVDLRTIPKTAALLDQKIASLSSEMAWWLDVLKRGWLPESERSMPGKCPGKPLYEHYIAHAQRTGVRHRQIETQIGIFLKRMIPMLESRVERWTRNDPLLGEVEDRGTVYFFPPLCDCRQAFENKLQQLIECGVVNCWGQDIDTPF